MKISIFLIIFIYFFIPFSLASDLNRNSNLVYYSNNAVKVMEGYFSKRWDMRKTVVLDVQTANPITGHLPVYDVFRCYAFEAESGTKMISSESKKEAFYYLIFISKGVAYRVYLDKDLNEMFRDITPL